MAATEEHAQASPPMQASRVTGQRLKMPPIMAVHHIGSFLDALGRFDPIADVCPARLADELPGYFAMVASRRRRAAASATSSTD
jgi:hypothetical protein